MKEELTKEKSTPTTSFKEVQHHQSLENTLYDMTTPSETFQGIFLMKTLHLI